MLLYREWVNRVSSRHIATRRDKCTQVDNAIALFLF
nr:MAG TPA: hypothetical protein [Caudoviricetes sp.]